MTIPRKPWHIRYEGSANSLRDADGNVLAFIPGVSVADHIVNAVNSGDKELKALEAELNAIHDVEISKLEDEINNLKEQLKKAANV